MMMFVAPLVGVWIEIYLHGVDMVHGTVAPLVGVWIEISSVGSYWSICGVAPLVGVWIEIISQSALYPDRIRRSPRGSVD